MKVFPIAKINLGLNVVERRADGYHNLQTVFYPVPISDVLQVEVNASMSNHDGKGGSDCELTVSNIPIEGDAERNLVLRAYRLLKEDFPTLPAVKVHLEKNIPTQAGMGGGSSDCAYMIRLLNEMFALGLSREQMAAYAVRLGADCAFFVYSEPCYAEGIGERLESVGLDLGGWYIGVVRLDIPVPTREAFSRIHPHYPLKNCREVVLTQPVETWREDLVNDFEESVFALHPKLEAAKGRLYDLGATYAAMSGSGSALFGLFKEEPQGLREAFSGMFTFCSVL